jgi:hypothetical protein
MTMSYASITVAEALTMDDYWAVDAQLGERSEGLIAEAAGCSDAGLHVITVWESKAHHERFVRERLVPAFGAAGVRPGPLTFNNISLDALYVREPASADR